MPSTHFFDQRAWPLGAIPRARWKAALEKAHEMERLIAPGSASWNPRGPTNVGGRITDLAVDQTDENIVYAAAAEGGVFRTTDGGQHWTPLFDNGPTLSMGALAIDPSDHQTIYAGSGEVNPGGGSVAYGGMGIFRSTDMGESWQHLGLDDTGSIGRILIDPGDPDRIYVAAAGLLWTESPDRGVYRTTDGGQTWEKVLYIGPGTGCVDLIMRPDNTDVIFAAMWERIRAPEAFDYGGPTSGVYRTTDGGDTWQPVGGGLPGFTAGTGRIGLSLCRSQPDVMHAVYADNVGYFDGLYRSTNGGDTWARTSDGSLVDAFASYGWWFGNVRTHPLDPDTIFVLGLFFYRSINGGASYSGADGGMHVDHHALDFGPGTDPNIYNGNDGGVYRSINGGTAWQKRPDLPVTQIYRLALDANNPTAIYAGAQDNGTSRTLTEAVNNWHFVFGGDGFQPLIHPEDSNHLWAQYQYGTLVFSNDNGANWFDALNGVSGADRNNWNSPLAQDPADPDRRYFGTNRLYRSSGDTGWTVVSPDLTGGPHLGRPGQVDGTLTTIGVSPADNNVIWTGSDDGYIYVSPDGGANWNDVSNGLPERWITAVRPDPHDSLAALVTISGFRWNEPMPHVYRTTNMGSSWTPIAGNLPDAPANDIIIDSDHPGRYFAATDVGVFETTDNGGTWRVLGAGLPHVVVTSLAFNPGTRTLLAGTYGRSVFEIDVDQAGGSAIIVCGPGPGEDNPPLVRLFDSDAPGTVLAEWTAYGVPAFGVNVACGDTDGDGSHIVLTGPGPGTAFGPHIRAFSLDGTPLPPVSFLAYGTHKYGVNVAAGDIDGDRMDEIITGAGPGAVFGPHIRAWNHDGGTGTTAIPAVSFLAYGTNRWGVNVSAGDIDGDGYDEIITGAGPGAVFGPHVRAWNHDGGTGTTAIPGVSYLAYGTNRFGVNIACGDLNGDGIDEIITGPGPGSMFSAHIRGWRVTTGNTTALPGVNFIAYDSGRYGASVAAADLDGDGIDEILTMPGPDPARPAQVRAWNVDGNTAVLINNIDFDAFEDTALTHGGHIAGQ